MITRQEKMLRAGAALPACVSRTGDVSPAGYPFLAKGSCLRRLLSDPAAIKTVYDSLLKFKRASVYRSRSGYVSGRKSGEAERAGNTTSASNHTLAMEAGAHG